MPNYEIRLFTCEYDPSHGQFEERFFSRGKRVLFPDGRRIDWQSVCGACRKMRAEWEEQRDIAKFQASEARKAQREEKAEFRDARQREIDLAKMANLEAQIALCTRSLETLRKKYFQNDDKNT